MKKSLLVIFFLHVISAHGQSPSLAAHTNANVTIQYMASLPMPLLSAAQVLPKKKDWFLWPIICGAPHEEQHILSRGTPVMYGDEFIHTNLNARFQNGLIKSDFTNTKRWECNNLLIDQFTF